MAKSGMYLNGKELLECELNKLTQIQRVESQLETHIKTTADVFKNISNSLSKKSEYNNIKYENRHQWS